MATAANRKTLVFDLETDGFLEEATRIHCAVMVDVETGEVRDYNNEQIPQFLEDYKAHIAAGYVFVGHNAIKFDFPMLEKLHGIVTPKAQCRDTMVLGRLVYPDIKSSDFERSSKWRVYAEYETALALAETEGSTPPPPWKGTIPKPFPSKLIGRHSLEAWGYRLGVHKGDYEGGFDAWSPEMQEYMIQDGLVTRELFMRLMAHDPSTASVELEHRIAHLCFQIEQNGFPFDIKAASDLYASLVDERETIRRELVGLFPNWKVQLPDFIPKRDNKTKGYTAGEPVERWKEIEFNPVSRQHIASRLIEKYNWKPTEFTQKSFVDESGTKVQPGQPVVDDDVLLSLPYPEAKILGRYFLLDKRIGQLAEGNQAWLRVQQKGKIHARYTPNGTVTGRATHSHPNISQVPRVSSPFGRECRALFHVPDGWVQVGADQQGLELRCLASDLSGLAGDGGRYARVVTEGDVHQTNMIAAGLPSRDNAKTFISMG